MENHAAYSEIGFLTKLIWMPYGHATAKPPVWELKSLISSPNLRMKSVNQKLFIVKKFAVKKNKSWLEFHLK